VHPWSTWDFLRPMTSSLWLWIFFCSAAKTPGHHAVLWEFHLISSDEIPHHSSNQLSHQELEKDLASAITAVQGAVTWWWFVAMASLECRCSWKMVHAVGYSEWI
jgi:hypothetical protein